jgi:hypothetical protein
MNIARAAHLTFKKIRPRIAPRPDPIRCGAHPTAAILIHTATTIAAVKQKLNLNSGACT